MWSQSNRGRPRTLQRPSVPLRHAISTFGKNLPACGTAKLAPQCTTPYFALTESDFGCLEPAALLLRPERIHNFLLQAQQSAAARAYWQKDLCESFPNPADHSTATLRRRVRYKYLLAPGATSFLIDHPAAMSRVHNAMWTTMLRRHLDAHITQDSVSPLRCAH